MRKSPKMGKSGIREAGKSMGFNGRVEQTGAHLQALICEKESEESGKRKLPGGRIKRNPSLLNLPPNA